MEVLTAFSLAGTVLEFSRFGLSLLRDSRELYKSSHGALSGNEQLELATADLRALLVKLKGREGSGTKIEEEKVPMSFQHILCGAEEAAEKLLRLLEKLKIRGVKSDKWEIVQTAIQNRLEKSDIEALTKKLEKFKDAVQPHLLFSILENLDQDSLRTSSRFDHLDESTQLIISSLLGNATNAKETTAVVQEIQDQMATLIQLVCRIDTINTNEHHRTRTKIINEQIQRRVAEGNVPEHPGTLKKITARFEMLDVSDAEEIKLRRNVQDDILKTLMYPAMTERYEDIGEAFPQTFEWAFEDSTTEQARWDNLSEWLMIGSGVYWISGKAGSGKSTLMKHIFEDFRTRKYLEQWAQGEADGNLRQYRVPFCLATFFFWNSGTPMQKSQHGLLRALLYQVLSSWPELIPVVLPDLWAWRYSDSIQGQSILRSNFDKGALIRGRLTSAFRKLTQQTLVPLKLCFLVDGLDEFDGDHEELASLFKLATNSPTVKICCSSRPWVIFEQIYGSGPSMRMQYLTRRDIQHYVYTKFIHNPEFCRLQRRNLEAAANLRKEIIDKAEGVFLWVELVVRSLLLGIRNQDDIEILRQRLTSMPQKLEDLYLHLLSLIEPVYWVWASKAFQIVRAARELCTDKSADPVKRDDGSTPLNISTFFFAMNENVHFSIEPNRTGLVEKVSSRSANTITQESLPARCDAVKKHLTARCAGLLEVPRFERDGPKAVIRFHHRTARDFLYESGRWSQMSGYTNGMAFEPHKALLMASVSDLVIMTADRSTRKLTIYNAATNVMLYAHYTNTHQIYDEKETPVLDILDRVMTDWTPDGDVGRSTEGVHWTYQMIGDCVNLRSNMRFWKLATLYGLENYVNEKLGQLDRTCAAQISSKLLYLLLPSEAWPGRVRAPFERPEMVSTLLYHGADPNLRHCRGPYQTSPWSNMFWYMRASKSSTSATSDRLRPSFIQIMQLLVAAGADLNPMSNTNELYNSERMVRFYIANPFPDESRELLNEMVRQKRLREADESELEANSPPRRRQFLVHGSEIVV